MSKIVVWLHAGGRKFKLPVDATHANITNEAVHVVRGKDLWCIPHADPHDVHVLRLGKRMQKGAWRAADHRHGRFAFRTPMVRRWTR